MSNVGTVGRRVIRSVHLQVSHERLSSSVLAVPNDTMWPSMVSERKR